jgi:hypothetical protein
VRTAEQVLKLVRRSREAAPAGSDGR